MSIALALAALPTTPAIAAGGNALLDGGTIGLVWVAPFAGLLLSIALLPLFAPFLWHDHYGKIAAGWALCFLVPFVWRHGPELAAQEVANTLLHEYLPFVILLLALFVVAGGVRVTGRLSGTPLSNTAILALGTLLASMIGTTGASILLIRPLVAANRKRPRNVHVFVFFIFLVSNVGGALTPLGDPPLFLGFLAGVPFFWPTLHLLAPTLLLSIALLGLFFLIDAWLGGAKQPGSESRETEPLGIAGKRNLLVLLGVLAAVLMSGLWHPGIDVRLLGVEVAIENLARDVLLLALTGLSLWLTPSGLRAANGFSWFPIVEVAKLFAGLFLTIIPAIAILRAGSDGALASWIGLVTDPQGQPIASMYFWLTGGLSSFLDNAPTYLMFFNTAGGDATRLTGPLVKTLVAVSAGAVFMGANTYVGNAPNFMVRAICEGLGIRMPSFFGYMAWSLGILTPLYLALTLIFFRA